MSSAVLDIKQIAMLDELNKLLKKLNKLADYELEQRNITIEE